MLRFGVSVCLHAILYYYYYYYYYSQRFSSMMSSARGRLAGRRIVVERRSQRGPGRSLLSRGQMVPLSEVPEELVEEVGVCACLRK